ncbi:MAG: hypothetical protein V8S34_04955 [Lawsonibacter sp.]
MVLHGDVGARSRYGPISGRRSPPAAWTIWHWAMSTPALVSASRENGLGLPRLSRGAGI